MSNLHQDTTDLSKPPEILTINRVQPSSGDALVIPDGCRRFLVDPSGTLAALTIKMPAKPYPGQSVKITFSQTITALTMQANSGQSFVGTPATTASAGTVIAYTWSASDSKWWPE